MRRTTYWTMARVAGEVDAGPPDTTDEGDTAPDIEPVDTVRGCGHGGTALRRRCRFRG